MEIKTEVIYNHLGLPRRTAAQVAAEAKGKLAGAIKKTADKAVEFAEAPFKTKVVIIETAEDHLE